MEHCPVSADFYGQHGFNPAEIARKSSFRRHLPENPQSRTRQTPEQAGEVVKSLMVFSGGSFAQDVLTSGFRFQVSGIRSKRSRIESGMTLRVSFRVLPSVTRPPTTDHRLPALFGYQMAAWIGHAGICDDRLPLYAFLIILMTNRLTGDQMSEKTTLTVRLGGALGEYVASNIGDNGSYENVSEYIRDLIRRDKQRKEKENFERLLAELSLAFQQPDESYRQLTAVEVIRRNQPAK